MAAVILKKHSMLNSNRIKYIIVSEQNDESKLWTDMSSLKTLSVWRRYACRAESKKYDYAMTFACSQVDRFVYMSEFDRQSVTKRLALQTQTSFIQVCLPAPPDYKTDYTKTSEIVYFGSLGYFPSIDALRWLIGEIMPVVWERASDCVLRILGALPPECSNALRSTIDQSSNIKITGPISRQACDDYIRRADMVVSPIRLGSGIKMKNLVALGLAAPLIATSASLRGSFAIPGQECLCADDTVSFADAIVSLLNDEARRTMLGQNGRAHFLKNHSLREVGDLWIKLLEDIPLFDHHAAGESINEDTIRRLSS